MSIKHALQCRLGKHEWVWQFLPNSCEQQCVCAHCRKVSGTRQQLHVWGEWQPIEGSLNQERICSRCKTQEERPIPVRAKVDPEGFGTLLEVPAGPFWMGSSRYIPDHKDSFNQIVKFEYPPHIVSLPTYWIGKAPVTVAQFCSFVRASGYRWAGADKKQGDGNHPVVHVTWFDAQAYCRWLTETWRTSGFIGANETVQLPSEAEWEKAARGVDGRRYPWGNVGKAYGHFEKLGPTKPVGSFSPQGDSPYGCVDMAGNVHEWTCSAEASYPYDPSDGREDPQAKGYRVVRGGNFRSSFDCVHTTWRERKSRDDGGDDGGFRVVVGSFSAGNKRS